MKKLLLFIFISISLDIAAQAPYGFEWIDGSKVHYKFPIITNGVYRIPYSFLQTNCPEIIAGSADEITIFSNGVQIPIYVSWTGSGSSTDYLEFYAKKLESEVDKKLYADSNHILNPYTSLFRDTNYYFLTLRSGTNQRMTNLVNDTSSVLTPYLTYCIATSLLQFKVNYSEGRRWYYTNLDYVYSPSYDIGEGWGTNSYAAQSFPTPNAVNITGVNARFQARLFGRNETGHKLEFKLNNTSIGDTQVNGSNMVTKSSSVPMSLINSATTAITVTPLIANNHGYILGSASIAYARNYNFSGLNFFPFSLPDLDSNQRFAISNYNSTQPVILYDFINKSRIVHGAGSIHRFMVMPQSESSQLAIINEGAIASINSVSKIIFPNLLGQQGDFVIISHRAMQLDSSGADIIQAYKTYKESVAGGSFKVSIAYMDELQELFGYGIPKHPVAIRKYLQWAKNTWTVSPPQYALLVGKGYNVNGLAFATTLNYTNSMIPSFGHAPSDYHYTTMDNSLDQFMPIGRLSATNGQFVKNYLEKLKEYNAEYNATSPADQNPAKKEYMKWMIHLGGGQGVDQQKDFRANLKSYETKVRDISHGSKVFSVFKNSPDISEDVSSVDLTTRIDKGVSLITFFGHSSSTIFDVGIGDPLAFTNKGKYPVFLANGCNSGYFYTAAASYSENFINQPNKGAIGFVATTNNALDVALYQYSNTFYEKLSKQNYNTSVGKLMLESSKSLLAQGMNYLSPTMMEYNLNGDPSVLMTQYSKEDYYIDNNSLIIPTANLNTLSDSFPLKIIVQNIGKAVNSTIKIKVDRLNNGRTAVYEKLVKAPYFKDTFTIYIPTQDNGIGIGVNTFSIKVDADDASSEISELNNEIKNLGSIYIENDDVLPIFPYEYSIISQNSAKLVAMSTLSNRASQRYHFQIDTTANFNSPILNSYTTAATSEAILSWLPNLVFQDSTVYYWRVSKDTVGKGYRWNNSSFIYISNQPLGGWNQSHYFQYLNNEFQNTYVGTNRKFQFVNDVKNILVRTDGSNGTYEVEWYLNNARVAAFREQTRITNGLFAIWIDGKSGIAKQSVDEDFTNGSTWGAFGSIKFGYPGLPREGFVFQDTGMTSALHPRPNTPWSTIITDFVSQIPSGDYVIFYSLKKPVYDKWNVSLINMFQSAGFGSINSLVNLSVKAPFIFGYKKNDPSFTPIAKLGTDYVSKTTQNIFITGLWKDGFTQSVKIGSALKWHTLSYQLNPLELNSLDTNKVELYGYKADKTKELLATYTTNKVDTNITWIDADKYINLQLKLSTKDDKDRTPTQLKYWRIYYEDIGEVAINNNAGQVPVMRDTIENGENLVIYYGSETLNNKAFDSLAVRINVTQGNQTKIIQTKKQAIAGNAFQLYQHDLSIQNYFEGENLLSYEINPTDFAYQKEKFNINNYGRTKFFVKSDIENPLLDVTFDGQHIINNELVSSEPKIRIVLKDENKYLLLNDTSLLKLFLKYPDGSIRPFYFNQTNVNYTLATSTSQNRAEISYSPTLADGSYQLIIKDADKSGNSSSRNGSFDYKISFQVITKNQISQFFNYPNPFTTSTQFVFTLTGNKLPDYIKIQIITIRGQVVKEIFKEQLGPIKLGVNRTQYAWDGRDEYGDLLANGVYLYKVTVKSNGEDVPIMDETDFKSITKSQNNLNQYFKNGWGKMVLIR
jgi:hypothetical protein